MSTDFGVTLQERLRQAERAEEELSRLQPIALEAPQLRVEYARQERQDERNRSKEAAISQAKAAMNNASVRQADVPQLLTAAAHSVSALFTALKECDAHRRKAIDALATADRIDYEYELEEAKHMEETRNRDGRGMAFALATKHGEPKVKEMLEEIEPGFALLRGCNMDDPLYRDVAAFVVKHAVPSEMPEPEKETVKEPEPPASKLPPIPPFPNFNPQA